MFSTSGSMPVAARVRPQSRRSRLEIAIAPSAVRLARRWTADQLAVDPPAGSALVDAAVLAVSELVTNAIQAVRAAAVQPGGQAAPQSGRPVLRLGGLSLAAGAPGVTQAQAPDSARVALVIERHADSVRIEVHDSSYAPLPQPCPHDDDDETGRGLTVVAALSVDWGWRPDQYGKVVWCDLAG